MHHGINPFWCEHCNYTSPHYNNMRCHLSKAHRMELPKLSTFYCKLCYQHFEDLPLKKKHMKFRHKLFNCHKCQLLFTLEKLDTHLKNIHGTGVPTCGVCGLMCITKHKLYIHQRKIHMMEKNVECQMCDRRFFSKKLLASHMIHHAPSRDFECKYCKKMFRTPKTRKTHEMIHTGERPKKCTICNEAFIQKPSLDYHMKKRHPSQR